MRWASLALLVLAAGCGGTRAALSPSKPRAPSVSQSQCQPTASSDLVVCGYPISGSMSMRPSTIWAHANGGLKRIAGPAEIARDGIPPKPVKNAHPVGFWIPKGVFRSPDGLTLLAQWSGACETQTAYLVSVATGKVRGIFVSNVRGILVVYESTTHGWTADGHARVRLSYPIFEKPSRAKVQAGMYDVDPVTLKRTLERRLPYGLHC